MKECVKVTRTPKHCPLFLGQANWCPEHLDVSQIPADLKEAHLDRGERDTLALAQVLGSRLVLMDESLGRQAARARGLAVRGSLGVLVEAYRRNLISADQFRLNVAEIARRRDIWISPELAERVLIETL